MRIAPLTTACASSSPVFLMSRREPASRDAVFDGPLRCGAGRPTVIRARLRKLRSLLALLSLPEVTAPHGHRPVRGACSSFQPRTFRLHSSRIKLPPAATIRGFRIMATSNLADDDRRYLATIGAKGGKAKSAKKSTHLSTIASKGGKTVTPKKLAHLRAMTAARVARQQRTAKSK